MSSPQRGFSHRGSVEVHEVHHCASCGARQMSLCADVPLEQLDVLEGHSHVFDVADGATLFEQSGTPQHLYTVIRGCIRLSTDLPDGRRQVVGFPMPGDYFGLTSLPRYDYAASALMPSRVCKIGLEALGALLTELRPMDQSIHQQEERMLCVARIHAVTLGRRTALERVAQFLVECLRHPSHAPVVMARDVHGKLLRLSHAEAEGSDVALPMTRADIADYLGLTVETVSRSFQQLRRRGLIDLLKGNTVRVVNTVALAHLAGAG